MESTQKAIQASIFSIIGNIALAIIKGCAGIFGNSYALIADAIESTTDIFTSIFVFIGIKFSHRPADENHPYGHGRAETMITFVVVAFLIVSASVIAYKSVKNIGTPHQLPEPWTLFVLAIIIIWKEVSFRIVIKKSRETNSSSLKAEAWHHRSDAITSVSAFIGISVALFFGEGYEAADDWAALFASGIILYNSFIIFRPALSEMMDEHIYDELVTEIREVSAGVEGIVNTEKCFIRKYGMQYHVDLHARVDGDITVREGHRLAHELKDKLQQDIPNLCHVLIHIEPC